MSSADASPLRLAEVFLSFFTHCETLSRIPAAWGNVKQIHLPKGKPPQPDGSVLAADLRPVSVSSIWWRVANNAKFRLPEVQQWVMRSVPSFLYGGIPGKGVEDAIAPLLVKEMAGGVVGTLDLDKAFERTSPDLACKVFRHLDMPQRNAALLRYTWNNQNMYLQYQGEVLNHSFSIRNSLPQGDCWAMFAMCLVLLPISNRIKHCFPATTQALYADDRSFVSPTPFEALQVRNMWHQHTTKIGLQESAGKEQFFHRNKPARRQLVKLGLPAASLQDATGILGFHVMPAQRLKAVGKEVSRAEIAKAKARKCQPCLMTPEGM